MSATADEVAVHIAEYNALSGFQRDAKSNFIKFGIYYHTGLLTVTAWLLTQSQVFKSVPLSELSKSPYVVPILLILPIMNAVLMVASAYQLYSFYCIALHFNWLRVRLTTVLSQEVLQYEQKFGRLTAPNNQLSLSLDVIAAGIWFVMPLAVCVTSPMLINKLITLYPVTYGKAGFCVGLAFSAISIAYLLWVIAFIARTKKAYTTEALRIASK
jgi:hypothetical protein